ncbi:GtrA family protein [Arcobacter aquimarinus]|uniref:Polysaccharide biosynthesis protein, GtrA family n=1 Tax=Arcobacter aquimarinus TaxID=1315211 RepID=A0AAE7B481_9BACT|nr:GtrA family protein [Arcobacter aquimarinus]QKE26746.1 polysaccharide biosynthesis protein, GtrA family [Arcobacter aquimarinus]RXI34450.1 polysaccharide biosynthesis protein GtrA [Arcobacter aquimarinus]
MLKKQIINFILVGIINTIFGYSIYALFIFFGFSYIVAVLFATILGILFNFKTISRYVFKSNAKNLIFKFIVVYFVLFITNILLIKFFKLFNIDEYFAGFLAIIPVAILSFLLNKFFVYKK